MSKKSNKSNKINSFLSTSGYNIHKDDLTDIQLTKIKKDLTVTPFAVTASKEDIEKSKYKIYKIENDIISVPRYYGTSIFGEASNKHNPETVNIIFNGKLRDYQLNIVDTCISHIKEKGGGVLVVPCGYGKCLKKGTSIIMYDGTFKNVEDIIIGDQIMGDDSTPRTILSLARGTEEMFDIISNTKEKYTVNRSHILSLKFVSLSTEKINDDIIDISVDDYLKLPKSIINCLYGYRVPLSFPHINVDLDFLHIWINNPNIHLPYIYKCNSEQIRLYVLSILIDTFGNLTSCNTGYVLLLNNDILFDDILYLARSLGFPVIINNNDIYKTIFIYGNCERIPSNKYKPINTSYINNLNYMFTVTSIGIDNYYGFEIDGNKRFVLGDFSVTHNTSMSIYLASVLKVKTLVLTHKSFLQDQWIDRCKQFTSSKIGTIRRDIIDIEGKDFVIGMVQSMSKRDYSSELFAKFGLIIVDECHHFSAKYFSKALAKAGTKYTIGLSATPYRSDGLIKIIHWYLGEIMFEKRLQINNQVVSKIITFWSKDDKFKEYKRYINGKVRPDCVKMINNLVELKCRNNHLINIINELRQDPNRKILILSGRKSHLKLLKESTDELIEHDIQKGIILKNECRTFYYTGDLKQAERFESEKYADILFATYDMAHEGLDIDRLNTIILATPKKDVVQAVGRILRKVLQDGDIRPLVIDVIDKISVFIAQASAREKFYNKSKYVQQYYYMANNSFVSPYDYSKNMLKYEDKNLSNKIPNTYAQLLKTPPVTFSDTDLKKVSDSDSDTDTDSDSDSEKVSDSYSEKVSDSDSDSDSDSEKVSDMQSEKEKIIIKKPTGFMF